MFYAISPPDETPWRVSETELIGLLNSSWPNASVWLEDFHPSRRVLWNIPMQEGTLEGAQDLEGQAQYLEGAPQCVARYAIWWRLRTPLEQELVLYDDSLATIIQLDPNKTEAQIVQALLGP